MGNTVAPSIPTVVLIRAGQLPTGEVPVPDDPGRQQMSAQRGPNGSADDDRPADQTPNPVIPYGGIPLLSRLRGIPSRTHHEHTRPIAEGIETTTAAPVCFLFARVA